MVFGLFGLGPPDERLVGRRLVAMYLQVSYVLGMPPAHERDELRRTDEAAWNALARSVRDRAAASRESLEANGAWKDLTPDEQLLFTTPLDQLAIQQRVNAAWLAECVACLLWACGILRQMPAWDTPTDPMVLSLLSEEAVAKLQLRPRKEIEAMRDIAELWHWRARTAELMALPEEEVGMPPGTTLASIVAEAAARAAIDRVIPEVLDGDFPARGAPYRALGPEALSELSSIARERHRAMNWLCGRARRNRWAEVSTDT